MNNKNTEEFLNLLSQNITNGKFIKTIISKKRDKNNELKGVSVKAITINAGSKLSFVYRYPTKDITKNYDISESLTLIRDILEKNFFQAHLFTLTNDWHLIINKKNNSSITQKPVDNREKPKLKHDKIKKRLISTDKNIYLHKLGITTKDWKIKNDMNNKYRQINKYIEIIDSILKSEKIAKEITIADMGSGKGYLTFALYDYLTNSLKLKPNITGIEHRNELVNKCNTIAKNVKFKKLKFKKGTIEKTDLHGIDILIALHACDTATDEAIYRGITGNSNIIITAPCCHNQIRKQINPHNDLKEITKHGILAERQAEIVTDTIRALILEANGYKTKVFEFISTEHTAKNILIVAIKKTKKNNLEKLKQIENIKSLYGIEFHYLEKLLNNQ